MSEDWRVDVAKDIRDSARFAGTRQAREGYGDNDQRRISGWAREAAQGDPARAEETVGLNEDGRPKRTGSHKEPVSAPPTLAEAGIDKKLSVRAQKAAAIPPEEFEKRVKSAQKQAVQSVEATAARHTADRQAARDEGREVNWPPNRARFWQPIAFEYDRTNLQIHIFSCSLPC